MTLFNRTREECVQEFRDAGGKKNYADAPQDANMIMDCIFEEFMEFNDVAFEYEQAKVNGLEFSDPEAFSEIRGDLCKEWADLQYVVSQAACYYEIPAQSSFNRVHDSNMTKVIDGKVYYRDDGKILKPESYQAPDMSGL